MSNDPDDPVYQESDSTIRTVEAPPELISDDDEPHILRFPA